LDKTPVDFPHSYGWYFFFVSAPGRGRKEDDGCGLLSPLAG
jgi:hypothetical protein